MTTTMDKTQTIDADALRARLAETPADLRGRTCTAAEAQALLDALMAANGLQCAAGRPCRACDARIDAVRALTDAAPVLVATITAQSAEAERLRALLAVTQSSLEAASSGRRVTACDDIERLQREIATLRASYAQDLDGLRAEVRRADDERATWRDLRDAAREYLDAGHAERCALADAMESPDDGLGKLAAEGARLDAARTRLAALVGGDR